jgi:hypothetical protein
MPDFFLAWPPEGCRSSIREYGFKKKKKKHRGDSKEFINYDVDADSYFQVPSIMEVKAALEVHPI